MRNVRTILAAISMLAVAAPGLAADMDEPVLVEAADEYQPVEVGSGWYIRGDISYAVDARTGDASYRTFDPISSTYGDAQFDTADLGADFGGSIGFGYAFSDYFRADVTADIAKLDFLGTRSSTDPCPAGLIGTTCRSEDAADGYVMSYLVNGYVDLGTYSGITPYVGAGVGVSQVKWDGLETQLYCVDGAVDCPGGQYDPIPHTESEDWRVTYAAMAGVSYDVATAVKLDLGYRYKHVEGGDLFGWEEGSTATGNQGTDDGYDFHEVKVGFRYQLW